MAEATSERGTQHLPRHAPPPVSWHRRLLRWLPALLCMVIIFGVSSISRLPEVPGGWLDYSLKKIAHISVYAVLTLSYLYALAGEVGLSRRQRYGLALTLAILYAFSDEWHQSFIPNRHGRLSDVGYDTLGALLALAFWHWGTPTALKYPPHQPPE